MAALRATSGGPYHPRDANQCPSLRRSPFHKRTGSSVKGCGWTLCPLSGHANWNEYWPETVLWDSSAEVMGLTQFSGLGA